MPVRRILFICYGNICRSPMAEGYLKKLLDERGVTGVNVGSAGLGAWDGSAAMEYAQQVAHDNGFSIDGHKSRMVTMEMLEESDDILVMEKHQQEHLRRHLGKNDHRVRLLGRFASGTESEIEDPYGNRLQDYERVFTAIKSAVDDYFKLRFTGDESQ